MSFLLATLRLGLSNLRLHKLRTALTSLGIILGVAAVIIMVSIGEGNKQAALRDIQALGATNIIVRSVRPPEVSAITEQQRSFVARYGLLRQDLRRFQQSLPHISHIVPLKSVGSEITDGGYRVSSQAFGTTPDLARVANLRIDRGRYLTDEDLRQAVPVAVIGSEIARKFFRLRDPLGSTFRIDQQVFRVVGVLQPIGLAGGTGSALVGRDLNLDIHIPLSTAELQFGDFIQRRTAGQFNNEEVQLSEIYVTSNSTDDVLIDAELVRRIAETSHGAAGDVQIIVPWELLENVKKTQMVWNIVLTAVAGISLLVGGIGIMNIMLASVTERTREIGIRRALGATRRHIVAQFLVETGSLSAVGGLLGIAVGVGLSLGVEGLMNLRIVRNFFDTKVAMETEVTAWSIVLSFAVAASVGLIFGLYPAVLASRQDPVVALRHD
jgi:putative ABC transport system permease protein